MNDIIRSLYLPFSERRQLRAFNALLKKIYIERTDLGNGFAEGIKQFLSRRAKDRKKFCKPDGRPVVAGFGSMDSWQRDGMWPGFRAVSDFHLYEVPNETLPGSRSEEHERDMKASGFLAFIDEQDLEKKVTCAFFYHSGRHISDKLIEELHRRGIWTVILGLDDKHQFSYPKDKKTGEPHQLRVARQVDLYWTNWKGGTHLVEQAGGNPWYCGAAANPEFYRPLDIDRDIDVVFIGIKYGAREKIVNELKKHGIKMHCFGAGWGNGRVSADEMVRLYNRAKVVLGIGGVGAMSGVKHLKGRDFEVPMCGALYLTSYNPELCDFFDIGREILCYSSIEECVEQIHWILRYPDESNQIRIAARKRSLKDHTWEKRLTVLFNWWSA